MGECPTIKFSAAVREEALSWNRDLLADPVHGAREEYDLRLRVSQLDPVLVAYLPRWERSWKLLDVGSGPLTTLGTVVAGHGVGVTATDLYGAEYAAIMDELGLVPPVRPVGCSGEDLIERFGCSTFDLVHCGNALDHCENPLVVLNNMLGVAKPGANVIVWCWENEGKASGYKVMHQWDLSLEGRLVFLSRSADPVFRCNLIEQFAPRLTCWEILTKEGYYGRRKVMFRFEKWCG